MSARMYEFIGICWLRDSPCRSLQGNSLKAPAYRTTADVRTVNRKIGIHLGA